MSLKYYVGQQVIAVRQLKSSSGKPMGLLVINRIEPSWNHPYCTGNGWCYCDDELSPANTVTKLQLCL